jgi:hypothetical protein
MPRNPNVRFLIEHVLSTSEAASMPERAKLYRGLAEICGCAQETAEFLRHAKEIEAGLSRLREFEFSVLNRAD